MLILTRDVAVQVLNNIVVAPITRRPRHLPSELSLGPAEGLHLECVASFDNLMVASKSLLTERAGVLDASRVHEICDVLHAAFDC